MSLLLFLLLFLIPCIALSADEKSSLDSASFSPTIVQEKRSPESVISEFLREVKLKSPVLYAQWEKLPDQELISRVFSGLNGPSSVSGEKLSLKKSPAIHFGVSIAGNRMLYIRVESLTQGVVQRLIEDCTNAGLLRVHRPVSLILDFRMSSGGDYNQIPVLLNYFMPADKKSSYFHSRPVAILTSGQTSGPAELLTVLLEKDLPRCITIGEPGYGRLFPETAITVGGQEFSIPVIPLEWSSIPALPHTPMILRKTVPVVAMDDLGNEQMLQQDPAVCCAMDMLAAIHAVK